MEHKFKKEQYIKVNNFTLDFSTIVMIIIVIVIIVTIITLPYLCRNKKVIIIEIPNMEPKFLLRIYEYKNSIF